MADEHDTPVADAPAPTPAAAAPGAALRDARSKKQLSLDELVVQTKLPLSVLEAMEADDFRTLTEPVYVRGYYRKYARVLGLEEAPIIAGYEAHGGAVTRKPEVSLLVPEDPRPNARWPLLVGLIVLLAVIAAAVNWYFARDDAASTSQAQPGSQAAAESQRQTSTVAGNTRPPATAMPARPATSNADSEVSEDEADAADETAADQPPVSQPTDRTASATPQPAQAAPTRETRREAASSSAISSDSLLLRFGDDSWVRVEDDTGQRLLNGLVQSGQTRELDGVPPYTVFLGYAPGVTVRFRGDNVAVAPHTRGNNTARFTVE